MAILILSQRMAKNSFADNSVVFPLFPVGYRGIDVDVTLRNNVSIDGGDVTIEAAAEAMQVLSVDQFPGEDGDVLNRFLEGIDEDLQDLLGRGPYVKVSYAKSDADINIDETVTINSADFVAHASAETYVAARPFGFGYAAGFAINDTHADVTVEGTIHAAGDVALRSTTDNNTNVYSDPIMQASNSKKGLDGKKVARHGK